MKPKGLEADFEADFINRGLPANYGIYSIEACGTRCIVKKNELERQVTGYSYKIMYEILQESLEILIQKKNT